MKIPIFLLIVVVCVNGRIENGVFAADAEATNNEPRDEGANVITYSENSDSVLTDTSIVNNDILGEEINKQETFLPSQTVSANPGALENLAISSELSSTAEAVVFSSSDAGIELKNIGKTQISNESKNTSYQILTSFDENEDKEYVVRAEPMLQVQTIQEEPIAKESNESETERRPASDILKKTPPQHEDIPSFSEWTQKQLAEAEKKKTDQNDTTDKFAKLGGKFRNKNYASPDCGAKIVAANPESQSFSSVLSPLKDEYMLNYCTHKIWFVLELCEAIQAKRLKLANFELFSSSPKDFSVYVSHRFPTRDWSIVGKFTAQDSRDIQTFDLYPHIFGKFVRIELHSHYGKEQFCPISWVALYGTSEYEVLAKEDEQHLLSEDDEGDLYEDDIGSAVDKQYYPKNLFSSATDAVLTIVKKATAPFMKTDKNDTESESSSKEASSSISSCVTPRYIVVCNNCSQCFYDEVFTLLSCKYSSLDRLISDSFVKQMLIGAGSCNKFGLDFGSLRTGAPYPLNLNHPGEKPNYLTTMLRDSVVAALCNVLAISQNKVVVNVTAENDLALKNITESEGCEEGNGSKTPSMESFPAEAEGERFPSGSPSSQFQYVKSSAFIETPKPSERASHKIEPTKTLSKDEVKRLPPSNKSPESSVEVQEEKSTESPSGKQVTSTATVTLGKIKSEADSLGSKGVVVQPKSEVEDELTAGNGTVNATAQYSTIESIMSDINAMEKAAGSPSSTNFPSASNLPAESIFLRLANRIKTLEINMSLSSTYLEELSKRYRLQLDLLSKSLNSTIQKIEEYSRWEEEKEKKKDKEILLLRAQLANLTRDVQVLLKEKNSWRPRASSISQHILFVSIEVLLAWVVFSYWKGWERPQSLAERLDPPRKISKRFKRRNSLEGVRGHETPRRKHRRPSDEALEIAMSRTRDRDPLRLDKKRKRKKKDSKCSINIVRLKSSNLKPTETVEVKQVPVSVPQKAPIVPVASVEAPVTTNVLLSNRFAPISSPAVPATERTDVSVQSLSSSPVFVKTALDARTSRLRSISDKDSSQKLLVSVVKPEQEVTKKESQKERKASSSFKKYMKKFF